MRIPEQNKRRLSKIRKEIYGPYSAVVGGYMLTKPDGTQEYIKQSKKEVVNIIYKGQLNATKKQKKK
jgi:hypothetical protein